MGAFNETRLPLTVVAGPTASGKTALAVALAKHLDGEVISADSMQVYSDFFIGTARPTEQERAGVPHHLIGFLPLDSAYSVAQYAADAKAAIADVAARGKAPILCGGTGLYIQAITENLAFTPEDDEARAAVRAQLRAEIDVLGGEEMLRRLSAVDGETAARLHPHDHGRIIRALEIARTTGVPMSEWIRRSKAVPPPYDTHMLVLDFRDRAKLYDRIDRRVDAMMAQGLLQEARMAYDFSPGARATAMQAIGYKELFTYFRGECSLSQAVENLKRGTRHYAKRQLSWFRRLAAHTLYVDEYDSAAALVNAALTHLKGSAT